MRWGSILADAIDSLRFRRRRSIVTITSLAWGVASFLILMSYGSGFGQALRSAFLEIGHDLVLMASGQTSEQAGGIRAGRRVRLRTTDAEKIKQDAAFVGAVSPEGMLHDAVVVRGRREKTFTLRSVWPEYSRIRNMRIKQGRWIAPDDSHHGRRVAILGSKVAKDLFSSVSPIGEVIAINGIRFTVVGLLESKVQISNYNRPDNQCVFIPYETMAVFRDTRYPEFIVWSPVARPLIDKAVKQVRTLLAGVHRFSPTDDKAVMILPFSRFLSIVDDLSAATSALLFFVGALTLGIGGVGLANIMLAAVIDRTREIGVLKALGAPRRSILAQFLAEALIIVLIGGIVGVAVGVAAAEIIGSVPLLGPLFKDQGVTADQGSIQFHISATSLVVSTGVLFLVGLIAGIIPAIRASKLDPADALRYE